MFSHRLGWKLRHITGALFSPVTCATSSIAALVSKEARGYVQVRQRPRHRDDDAVPFAGTGPLSAIECLVHDAIKDFVGDETMNGLPEPTFFEKQPKKRSQGLP